MKPLAEQLRPDSLEEIYGQEHLLGDHGFLTGLIKAHRPLSIILWGPPGCGKTSIARLYAKAFGMRFETLSAVFSGIADIKRVIKETEESPLFGNGTLLFVDEIHRFNKAQQDAFLPYLERGTLILVGATVENPSFYLNNALLSRVRVLPLKALDEKALEAILERFESKNAPLPLTQEARQLLIHSAQGDGRYLLNLVENVQATFTPGAPILDEDALKGLVQKRAALYDKGDEQHYNLISALHKSIRGSDPDAALYWFSRMLEGGEEPLFIARRLIRMASEDIGLADPQALSVAIGARDAYEMLGSPEGELSLAEAVIYLSLSPKSNATYVAYSEARKQAAETSHLNPPAIILNAPTKLMRELGYGKGYQYDHDTPAGFSGQNYFPDGMERKRFYEPVSRGFEREMRKRLDYFEKQRKSPPS